MSAATAVAMDERDDIVAELLERYRQRDKAERAALREASARRELADSLQQLDPEWRDPRKVKARVRELNLTATALFEAFALIYHEMRWVELRGLWAATVDAQGDTDIAHGIWHRDYGADMVTALNWRIDSLTDGVYEVPVDDKVTKW